MTIGLGHYLSVGAILFTLGILGIFLNRKNIIAANPALLKIGAIIHSLEMRGEAVPEAAGVQTLLQGAHRRATAEVELLAEAEKTFDLLYEAYYEPAKR